MVSVRSNGLRAALILSLVVAGEARRGGCKHQTSSTSYGYPVSEPAPSSSSISKVTYSTSSISSSAAPSESQPGSSSSLSSILPNSSATSLSSSAAASSVESSELSSASSLAFSSSLVSSVLSSSAAISSSLASSLPSSTVLSSTSSSSLPEPSSSSNPVSSACSAPPTTVIAPATCWGTVPSPCSSLNRTPSIPWPAVTPMASQCRNAFVVGGTPVPEVAACLLNINAPQFNAASAYTCVSNAPVYCSTTVISACGAGPTASGSTHPPAAAPTVIDLAGFESGTLAGWTLGTNSGPDSVITASVSSEVTHAGSAYALRTVFSNTNGGSRGWIREVSGMLPGETYELSWWWYSTNGAASTVSRVQYSAGGSSFVSDAMTRGGPVGEWVRHSRTFEPAASVARFFFSVYGNIQGAANVFYVDDMVLTKL